MYIKCTAYAAATQSSWKTKAVISMYHIHQQEHKNGHNILSEREIQGKDRQYEEDEKETRML